MAAFFGAAAVIHTPCSVIYLAPTLAFKVKKPVDLGYLDFRSPAARLAACRAEITLNAALAPGVYRRLIALPSPLRGAPSDAPSDDRSLEAAQSVAIEMRRLPASGMLDAILAAGTLDEPRRQAIVDRLSAFHAACPDGPSVAAHGSPDAVAREVLTNLDECLRYAEPAPAGSLPPALLATLRARAAARLEALRPLLARRVEQRRIREGHGDLHAGNICFDPAAATPDNPTGLIAYDRIEFRADFRCKDVAAELACLAYSCDAAGHPQLADDLCRRYAHRTADTDLVLLQPLYRAHYAAVRAKVHAARTAQPDAPADERAAQRSAARADLCIATAYGLPPALIITSGLPGSGKSVVGRAIARALRADIHQADRIRKSLIGCAPTDRPGPDAYTPDATRRTYAAVSVACAASLAASRACIADATFPTRESRAALLLEAARVNAPAIIVHCHADDAETRRRLAARTARNTDPSDADWQVYLHAKAAYHPPADDEGAVLHAADADPADTAARVIARLAAGA